MHTLMLGQVLPLLEAFITASTLIGLLPGVDTLVPIQVRRVLDALLACGTQKGHLSGRVAAVLHKL